MALRPLTLVILGATLLLSPACDSRSPSEPAAAGTGVKVVIQDPEGLFADHHATIRGLIDQTASRAAGRLPVGQVTITVTADPGRSIPGYGLGGYAPNGSTIEIVLDPSFPLGALLPERLPLVTAHELHHAVRWRGPGYGNTLLEAMISEGLADHFAIELLGTLPPPWSDAFPGSRTRFYLDRARPELDSTTFDFGAWFFGIGGDLPVWTGYTLGFRLVEDYQARSGRSAAELVTTPAEVFRPD